MVGAWVYCIEVCYNIMYYFVHVIFVISLIFDVWPSGTRLRDFRMPH